jgi:predicted nucleic acid-binding protein
LVFVDTGAWFARHVPSDPDHARVKAWFDDNPEPLLTTDYCVDETVTLLARRGHLRRAVQIGRALIEGQLARLHFVTPDQIRRAWVLFEQYAPAGWSFTDCTSKVVVDPLGIRTAVALDQHFRRFVTAIVVP